MLRGDTEARIQLTDEYANAELVWTFVTGSREEFIKNAVKIWDWFMNDPVPGLDSIQKTEETEE